MSQEKLKGKPNKGKNSEDRIYSEEEIKQEGNEREEAVMKDEG
jgi:hypothetical protein